ncbi:MAG: (d)CMP kinase [Pseudomonadota bacterium]
MIIAVDGPAASGKGTLSARLAARFGLAHLDTGRLYRAVALALLRAGQSLDREPLAVAAAHTIDLSALGDDALKTPEVSDGASRVAVYPAMREILVARQRAFAQAAEKGAVLDGRDIGTVVFPDAALKLYITASVEERARRRALELFGVTEGEAYENLLSALKSRDARDQSRAASPLRPAADAHVIDTTDLSIEEALKRASSLVENARLT